MCVYKLSRTPLLIRVIVRVVLYDGGTIKEATSSNLYPLVYTLVLELLLFVEIPGNWEIILEIK